MHRRIALITAASIVAVVVTGATAIGANIGILSNASASDVGDLVAVAEVETATPVATSLPSLPSPVPTAAGAAVTIQGFDADAAGGVSVEFTADVLRLGSVAANPGWTWSSSQSGDQDLTVVFVSQDGREFRFAAELRSDGSIAAKVDELIVEAVQGQAQVVTVHRAATAAAPTSAPTVVAATTATTAPPPARTAEARSSDDDSSRAAQTGSTAQTSNQSVAPATTLPVAPATTLPVAPATTHPEATTPATSVPPARPILTPTGGPSPSSSPTSVAVRPTPADDRDRVDDGWWGDARRWADDHKEAPDNHHEVEPTEVPEHEHQGAEDDD